MLRGTVPSLEQAYDGGGSGKLSAPRLRTDTPERAGLDPEELRHLVRDVRALTEGDRPRAPAAVVLAGRGPVIAVEEAAGWAVRYEAYDERADRGRELPPDARVAGDPPDPLRPGLPHQAVHRGGGNPATGTRHPRHRREGGGVPPRLHGRRRTRSHRPPPPHPHLRVTSRTAAVRLPVPGRPSGDAPLGGPDLAPGTAHVYSDLNLLLLQHVLERLTGRTLDILIRDGITHPLGMVSTAFGPCPAAAATEDQRHPWAKADRGMVRGHVHDENAWSLGGVVSRGPLLDGPGPGDLLPHPARGRFLRPRAHPRPRFRRADAHPAGSRLRPRPDLVHGRVGGPGCGQATPGSRARPWSWTRRRTPSSSSSPTRSIPAAATRSTRHARRRGPGWRGRCGEGEPTWAGRRRGGVGPVFPTVAMRPSGRQPKGRRGPPRIAS